MSNVPRQNPHRSGKPERTVPTQTSTNPDDVSVRKTKVQNPTWSQSPDSTRPINSAKSANPSMPWSEPEIDEVSPFGPGDRYVNDD